MTKTEFGSPATREAWFKTKAFESTPEQLKIQLATDHTILVRANAGAAKTTTLALRIAESWKRGAAPQNILALTYTDTACTALKEALKKIGVPHAVVQKMRIQTFEAFAKNILDDMLGQSVPTFVEQEKLRPYVWQAIYDVEAHESERYRQDLVLPSVGSLTAVEEFLKSSIRLKGTLTRERMPSGGRITPDYAEEIGADYTQLKIYAAFESIRRRAMSETPLFRGTGDATFDLGRLLYDGESIEGVNSWPSSTTTFVVDEMHDMNWAMFTILQRLLDSRSIFFCGVGDADQVIHDAAGAEAYFMESAIQDRTTRVPVRYPLTPSFRFGKSLAVKAGRLTGKAYASLASETKVELHSYDDETECSDVILTKVKEWKASRGKMDQFAILLRHPYQSVDIENALLSAQIPYDMLGMDSYLMRPEVLFVRGLLAVATDKFDQIEDAETRRKVLRSLVFFTGAVLHVHEREHESQETLLNDAVNSVTDAPNFMHSFFNNQILPNVDHTIRFNLERAILVGQEKDSADKLARLLRAANVQGLMNEVFVTTQRRKDAVRNLRGLEAAAAGYASLEAYFTSLNKAELLMATIKDSKCLQISTIAQVKGMEFEHVVIPYLEQGVFPESDEDRGQERNLMYVGMTRARSYLTVIVNEKSPSSFVADMGYTRSQKPQA
jgi:DNA helicase-2/ATP-dependent DNA helicase PcrA